MEVVAALVLHRGKLLLTRRPEHKRFAGMWEFPGGKIEPGETPQQALRREMREELGVDTRIGALYARIPLPSRKLTLSFFHCRLVSGEPAPQEGQAMAWVALSELTTQNFIPTDASVIQRIREEGLEWED